MYPQHLTMKSILDKEEARKSGHRPRSAKRNRPKTKNNLDLLKALKG